jgi:putative membrane protein
VLVVTSALMMWMPVCGPLPELRFTLPVQMVYLFLQSIIPTVPAGWLTFAEGIVYKHYDVVPRVFGLSASYDQQLAGLFMKIGAGMFLWTVIAVLFVRFATTSMEDDRGGNMPLDRRAPVGRTPEGDVLTWEDVQRQLADAPPAPAEPTSP